MPFFGRLTVDDTHNYIVTNTVDAGLPGGGEIQVRVTIPIARLILRRDLVGLLGETVSCARDEHSPQEWKVLRHADRNHKS